MPIYEFYCHTCGQAVEKVQHFSSDAPSCTVCNRRMVKKPSPLAFVRIDGEGYPSRRKWMDNWTPKSKALADIGKVYGAPYESKTE